MKLKKCYVFSFGKLQDKTFDLNDGLNTFKEDNGWGKSTLATFIKAIFYGLNDSKKSVAENERIKYKTWNSTQKFGGYIEFEWGGKHFKLERYFGNKESEDTVSLVDLETGKSFNNTENLGARIFQIDQEGFLSTTYFSQKDFQVKSNTSITAKFNSICEIQDSDAFDKALSKLEEKCKTYKKTGDKGLIADVKREIFAVGEKIQSATLAGKTAESLKANITSLESETIKLKQKTENLAAQVTDAGKTEAISVKKQQYNAYLAKKEQYDRQKAELENVLNGQRPNEQELNAYLDCCKELNNVSANERVLLNDLQSLNNEKQTQKPKPAPKLLLSFILAILAPILVAIGVCLMFIDLLPISLILFGLAVISVVACVLLRFFLNKNLGENSEQITPLIEQKIHEYEQFKGIRENYEQRIDEYLGNFNVDSKDKISAINLISSTVKNALLIDKEIKEINGYLAGFEKDKELFENLKSAQNLNELKRELSFVQDEYSKKATELAKKRADIKYYQDQADTLSELEERKTELINKQEQYKEEYQIALRTLEFLNKANENLKIKYRAPLQDSLNKYLSLITGSKKTALIDVDLNVTVEENGGAKQPDYYSKGEQNLFEICKRFALTDVLFTGEKPFIILDDPFYNLDDQKLAQALELVKKLSKEYQIIYFVCHESRRA